MAQYDSEESAVRSYGQREIYLVAFQGVGYGQPEFDTEADALIHLGHAALSFAKGGACYGFQPSQEEVSRAKAAKRDLLNELFREQSCQGQVFDDTRVFMRAWHLDRKFPTIRKKCTVWEFRLLVSNDEFSTLLESVQQQVAHPELTQERYMLDKGNPLPANHYNCALWPIALGVSIPFVSGKMSSFVPAMRAKGAVLWNPDTSLFQEYGVPGD